MHDVAGEIACAEGCEETISANVLKVIPQYCIVHRYCARYLRHLRAHERVLLQNVRDFPSK